MRYLLLASLLFIFPLLLEGDEPAPSIHAGACARRCRSNSSSIVEATLVDPVQRKCTRERAYIYSTGNPAIICRCRSTPVRHRTRAEREVTASLVRDCSANCRAGMRLYPEVLIVDPDGHDHGESMSILQYEPPIACLCTGISVDVPEPPAPPRRHPEQ